MKLDVVVDGPDTVRPMREAAGHRTDIRFFQAPQNLDYVLPFPFVMYETDSNEVIRTYGQEAEKLFYEVVAGRTL